ncbi:hypothetical protein BJF92_11350 [Rhizobium rhizosphaerae]|uniref:Tip attachment protein J domain-containing protein n=1 Tax=Xaviernesmea rhizosphaerae TaxID=1672749 RepID=A0A1Q9AMP3_9HYPH|nr:hypothetical protein BJF92_11350 [Xaviernesmea rhizosphaerae]
MLLNALGFWLMAEPAHAAFVAAIPAFLTAIGSTAIGKLVLGVIAMAAHSLLGKALAPKQKARTGVKLDIEIGDDRPVSAVLGYYAAPGRRKYAGTWGSSNRHFVDVIEIASLPSAGLRGMWIDDERCTILWNEPDEDGRGYPIKEFRKDDKDHAWIIFHDGTQTAADAYLVEHFGTHEKRPWTSAMVGRGITYAVMTYRYSDKYWSGVPACIFEPQSIPLYDIRKDSTAGGNGSHRWDNPATWEPSVNPVVLKYNIIRGIFHKGEWFYGGRNVAAHRLPASNWIAGANEAGRLLVIPGQDTEPQFRAGIEISGDIEPLELVDDLRAAANARIAEVGGIFKVQVGGFGAPVLAITDADIVITKGQSFEPFPRIEETVNGINATYPNPDEKWKSKDAPPLYDADLEADDGDRRLTADVQFPAVPFARQTQRLMRAMLKEERRFRVHQFFLPPEAWVLEPAVDVITWTSARNRYVNKRFLVVDIEGELTMNQLVTLKEIDPSDYDPDAAAVLPTPSGWIGRIEEPVQIMQGWTAEAETILDADGRTRRPAIRVRCATNLDDVRAVHVKVRLKTSGAVLFDSDAQRYDPASASWLLSGAWCLPATDFEVSGRLIPISARDTAWGAWLPVRTPDVRLSIEELAAEVQAQLTTLKAWIDDGLADKATATAEALAEEARERAAAIEAQAEALAQEAEARAQAIHAQADALAVESAERAAAISAETDQRAAAAFASARLVRGAMDDIAAIRSYVTELSYDGSLQRDELRRSLSLRIGEVSASFNERITVALSQTSAIAERVTTLEVTAGNLSAAITEVDTARVNDNEAFAQRLAALTLGTDNQFDPARLWAFETGAEGWAGSPAVPVAADGWLRPANGAADPYITSPTGLGISANAYRQLRGRLELTGAPTWEGRLWWRGPADTTWTLARSVTIAAPTVDSNGVGLFTFNPSWSGTIDAIRLDLVEAQTASDGVRIDWLAIGSPSPGASRAELLAEQKARIDSDSAMATSITWVRADLTSIETDVTGIASGVQALTSDVEAIDGRVTAQGEQLVTLTAEVDGKASSEVVDQLQATAQALSGITNTMLAQGSSVRAIRSVVDPLAMAGIEAGFARLLGDQDNREATAQATQTLNTRIEQTGSSLAILAEATTKVQAALGNKAESSALASLSSDVQAVAGRVDTSGRAVTGLRSTLDPIAMGLIEAGFARALGDQENREVVAEATQTLTTRIEATQGNIDVLAEAVTAVRARIGQLAEASAVATLATRVTATEGSISSQASSITALNSAVANKAEAAAVSSLSQTVTVQGNTIASQGTAITSLNNAVAGKASSSALSSLASTVSQQGDALATQSTAITNLNNAVAGKASSAALSSLDSKVTQQGDAIATQSMALTNLSNEVAGKASSSALSSLASTVSSQGDALATQSTAITNLNNAVAGKASSAALSSLDSKVTTQGDTIASHSAALTSLGNDLAGKASASALSSLSNTVSQQGNTISAQGQAITSLTGSIANKAEASAVSTLSQTVQDQGGQISANAFALTQVQASLNGVTANAKLKIEAVAGPEGYSRIGFYTSVDSNGQTRAQGLYLDQPTDPSKKARVVVDAEGFAIIDGSGGNPNTFFAVENGVTVIPEARIGTITTDKVIILDNAVKEDAIDNQAVAQIYTWQAGNVMTHSSGVTNIAQTEDLPKDAQDVLVILGDVRVRASVLDAANAPMNVTVSLYWGSTYISEAYVELDRVTPRGKTVQIQGVLKDGAGSQPLYLKLSKDVTGTVTIGLRTLNTTRNKKALPR